MPGENQLLSTCLSSRAQCVLDMAEAPSCLLQL